MKKSVFLGGLFAILLILGACAGGMSMDPKKMAYNACMSTAKSTCQDTAKDSCKDAGGGKSLCVKAAVEACMIPAKEACKKAM
ncbi:MAG: hypothetical protein IIC13_10160 [SAR324 cluster bacterium]|nr:hypothetical protein [SAR324 cluster bacterium]MCH8886942.1 hypothetical protein [SAR324 cluster bacterium]